MLIPVVPSLQAASCKTADDEMGMRGAGTWFWGD